MKNLKFIDKKKNKKCNKKAIKLYNEAFPKEERIPIKNIELFYALNKWIKIAIVIL